MREGNLDAALVEGAFQAAQVVALDVPLLQRRDAEARADHDRGVVPFVDAGDLERVEDAADVHRVGAHLGADLAHHVHHAVDVLAVADADVDHRLRVAAAHVDDRRDGAVGHEVHVAVVVAQLHVAQRHFLDQAGVVPELDDVALADLVLEQQEEAREVVLHQALCAEADGEADHARRAEDRRHRNAELGQHQHDSDHGDDDRGEVAEHAAERLGALHRLAVLEAGRDAHPQPADAPVGDQDADPGGDDDADDAQGGGRHAAELGPQRPGRAETSSEITGDARGGPRLGALADPAVRAARGPARVVKHSVKYTMHGSAERAGPVPPAASAPHPAFRRCRGSRPRYTLQGGRPPDP